MLPQKTTSHHTDKRYFKKLRLVNFKMRIYNAHGLNRINDALEAIKSQPDFKIIIELIDDPIVRQYLYHEDLREFWDKILRAKDLQPHPIIHSLHLCIGYYFYNKACRISEKCEKKTLHFLKAEEYGCFDAILELNDNLYDEFCDPKNTDKNLIMKQMLARMTRLANLHATPGFIHLAKICLHIGNYWKSINNSNAASTSYAMALQHLYTAKKLLPYSEATINNAYSGQGLAASNKWGIDNIDTAIKSLVEAYPCSLDQATIARAQKGADFAASALISIFRGTGDVNQHLATHTLAHYEQQQPVGSLRAIT